MTEYRRNDGSVSTGALGALLGIGPDGVRAAERRGQLPAAEETPGGHRRWNLRAVAAFLEGKGRAVPARLAAAIGGGASTPPAPPAALGPYRAELPPGEREALAAVVAAVLRGYGLTPFCPSEAHARAEEADAAREQALERAGLVLDGEVTEAGQALVARAYVPPTEPTDAPPRHAPENTFGLIDLAPGAVLPDPPRPARRG